ncbi:MAG: hypothetical protein FWE95_06700 [Planctomycetaceae bacterium]|nr:hypothetical protein [Planctomycetaceae bacterium]
MKKHTLTNRLVWQAAHARAIRIRNPYRTSHWFQVKTYPVAVLSAFIPICILILTWHYCALTS